MDKELIEYRVQLVNGRYKAQEQFDKALLTLSGGALGISFAFVDKFINSDSIQLSILLILSWSSWGLSIFFALIGFYLAPLSFIKAIQQVDKGTIHEEHAGGIKDKIVGICNFMSMFLFIIGIVKIIIFVSLNYGA